jgi:hypothetical protein
MVPFEPKRNYELAGGRMELPSNSFDRDDCGLRFFAQYPSKLKAAQTDRFSESNSWCNALLKTTSIAQAIPGQQHFAVKILRHDDG